MPYVESLRFTLCRIRHGTLVDAREVHDAKNNDAPVDAAEPVRRRCLVSRPYLSEAAVSREMKLEGFSTSCYSHFFRRNPINITAATTPIRPNARG